jgi:hypothetical protein
MRYPKLITIEFRKEGQEPEDGFHITVHWFEIFWSEDGSTNYIEIASDTDEHGDYIWEQVTLVAEDCYSFRGETYDFMAIRPIDTDEIVEVVRALWEMVQDTHDLENVYLSSERKSFPNKRVEEVISTLSYAD